MKIFVAGGGSGGHALPLISLIEAFKKKNPHSTIFCLGREEGIEKDLLANQVDQYLNIPAGKLRRYFSWKNFIDPFLIFFAFLKSFYFFLIFKSSQSSKNFFFSSGGFVALPPLLAAYCLRIPVFFHEQTTQIGLANYLSKFFAQKIFLTFPESQKFYPSKKSYVFGYPLRDFFFQTKTFNSSKNNLVKKKIILITGGGNGSKLINKWVKFYYSQLVRKYYLVHQIGKKEFPFFQQLKSKNYFPLEFLGNEEWVNWLKQADLMISRSGAGIVSECIFLQKMAVFIPLKIAQKNEQYQNALAAQKVIDCQIIPEEELLPVLNLSKIDQLIKKKRKKKKNQMVDIRTKIIKEIQKGLKGNPMINHKSI